MSITREKKLDMARMIIEESKARGLYKPMSSGQYPTPNLLANSHSLKELREAYKSIVKE